MTKISLNVDDDLLKWFDRFSVDGETKFTRTQTIETDAMFYITLLKTGMSEVVNILTYEEFVILLGCFNSTLYSGRETPGSIAANVQFYMQYDPEFSRNCETVHLDKEPLIKKLENFSEIQWYGLVEWARRFWNQKDGSFDEAMENAGLKKEYFAE